MPCLRSGTGIVEGGCMGCPKKMIPIRCSISSLTPAASMILDAGMPRAPVSHLDANPSEARLNMKLPHAAATARAQRGSALRVHQKHLTQRTQPGLPKHSGGARPARSLPTSLVRRGVRTFERHTL